MAKQKILFIALFASLVTNSHAFIVNLTATSDGQEKPRIFGTTNLPDGVDLMLSVHRSESHYFAQAKVKVLGGKFNTQPFTQNSTPLPPGVYKLQIETPMAGIMDSKTWPAIGSKGEKLEGPLVKNSNFGGNFVEFKTTFIVGTGLPSTPKDEAAREQEKKNSHEWWMHSCQSGYTIAQAIAKNQGKSLDIEEFHKKCIAAEPRNK
ncbi:MAG: hypothetical protein RBT42_14160 [Aquabacterium sp.]|jgi:hypothetical protein|uniref:hypothetical protein n=1 Tax=Aquabacterium sp. TaxID=1872578 RepID=UPI002A366B01|nr:hypothetical protein [Aquabacterium sp.]MDX9844886.1 hypothetical protein [Aquabacterium sp.]